MPAAPNPQPPPSRIRIESPLPLVDCGRFPSKATAGDSVHVAAEIFRDGHDVLRAVVRYQAPGETSWSESELRPTDHHIGGYAWAGSFPVDRVGRWRWTLQAFTDPFASWRSEVRRKVAAAEPDLSSEILEGLALLRAAAERAEGDDRALLQAATASTPEDPTALLGDDLAAAAKRWPDRTDAATMQPPLEVDVERERARFGAWYELFPRSWGGFSGVQGQLATLAELGFDVLYVPPIHPIGVTNRKGPNNTLTAGPDDPGSPWAIGGVDGGHKAIHPDLGSEQDFDDLVAAARDHGIEIALDFAIQCSADHPWLTEHPEWFHRRPDGTLKYAENPPKKYQDIYNVNWDSPAWRELWDTLLDVVLHWVGRGIRVFRVDNPHTKPVVFWEWLIAEVRKVEPDVVFLSEAFTKLPMLRALGKAGFSQSYTYFTWKNTAYELREYLDELLTMSHVVRPNFFVNTPDILTDYLVRGGPGAFNARLVLAATLSPSYGIYSGFESFENVPLRPGSEEYLDTEKFQLRRRALNGPLLPTVRKLNHLRRAHPALQHLEGLFWLTTENEQLAGYAKRADGDIVLVVVNLDPHDWQQGVCVVPSELGLPPVFGVHDEISGDDFDWRLGRNFVSLPPGGAHVLTLA